MKEELISFETAVLAKEKEFDWQVTNYYTFNGISGKCSLNSGFFESEFRQPTQSLLQKWLREKHNLFVDIVEHYEEWDLPLSDKTFPKPIGYFYWDKYNDNFCVENANKFNTYEEALEVGLQEVLKLINNG